MSAANLVSRTFTIIAFIMTLSGHTRGQSATAGHYADINGLRMYYELYGSGKPLVLIHGGGSTIESSFGNILPGLAKKYRIIAIELQAHGRTKDIDRPLSFEQDADDIAALLEHLNIKSAAIFGFSNGGTTAIQMAIRHPQQVERLVLASPLSKRSGAYSWLWDAMQHASLDNMPQALKDAYLKVSPDPKGLQTMHDKDVQRMVNFKDIRDEDIHSVTVPALVLVSDEDVVRPEHAVELYRLFPRGRLVILPGGHGEYMGEIASSKSGNPLPAITVTLVETFLEGLSNR